MDPKKWGRCPWSYQLSKDKIHPEDLEKFSTLHGSFVVYEYIETDGDYIIIKWGNYTFRVKPDIFKEVKEPKYKIGDTVKIKGMDAIICLNEWHDEKKEHYYFVTINGKRKSRRYFESELTSMELQNP